MSGFEDGYVYRLTTEKDWAAGRSAGTLPYNAADERDGFFHLSRGDQAQETARRHYQDELGLLALAIPEAKLSGKLKNETNEDGETFPHYYGQVDATLVDHALRLTRGMGASYMVVARIEV